MCRGPDASSSCLSQGMFGLLFNLYKFVKEKSEKKICIVVLGVDNAGKTTLLNTVQGELDKEVSPTFGFSNTSTSTKDLGLGGRNFSLQVFDLGGGKNIRRVWKSYLAEVHGVVYVVDAADSSRFGECKEVLADTLKLQHLWDKPILVFANKQDLPAAATAAEVAQKLGLSELKRNKYQILPCEAKTPAGQQPDPRLREGLKWLVSAVESVYGQLDARVQREADEVKQEELRKKKERDERVRQLKEERARAAAAAEEAERAAAAAGAAKDATEQQNALSILPGGIESPKPDHAKLASLALAEQGEAGEAHGAQPSVPLHGPGPSFSDLHATRAEQGRASRSSSRQNLAAGLGESLQGSHTAITITPEPLIPDRRSASRQSQSALPPRPVSAGSSSVRSTHSQPQRQSQSNGASHGGGGHDQSGVPGGSLGGADVQGLLAKASFNRVNRVAPVDL